MSDNPGKPVTPQIPNDDIESNDGAALNDADDAEVSPEDPDIAGNDASVEPS